MREFDRELGRRLHQARTETGLSQAELANRIGITQDAISLYERGARSIGLDTLVSIARELNKPLNYFLEDHDALVVVRDSRLQEVIADAQEHPGEIDLLCDVWQFLKWRRSRSR